MMFPFRLGVGREPGATSLGALTAAILVLGWKHRPAGLTSGEET